MESKGKTQKYRIGLALSGGGARGFAHLGVYKAMEELGIKPDIVSGTSAGALAGSLICTGYGAEEAFGFFKSKKILDFARPRMSKTGFFNMTGLEILLKEKAEISSYDNLKIPLVITATNMNIGIPVHFRKGDIIRHIMASCAIPLVFCPITIDEHQYSDGGVFMNFPVKPIRQECEIIIGVHIDPLEPNEKITNFIHLAERSFHMCICSNMEADSNLCDILIAPEHLSRYSMFDLANKEKIFDKGYEQAMKEFTKPEIAAKLGIKNKIYKD